MYGYLKSQNFFFIKLLSSQVPPILYSATECFKPKCRTWHSFPLNCILLFWPSLKVFWILSLLSRRQSLPAINLINIILLPLNHWSILGQEQRPINSKTGVTFLQIHGSISPSTNLCRYFVPGLWVLLDPDPLLSPFLLLGLPLYIWTKDCRAGCSWECIRLLYYSLTFVYYSLLYYSLTTL